MTDHERCDNWSVADTQEGIYEYSCEEQVHTRPKINPYTVVFGAIAVQAMLFVANLVYLREEHPAASSWLVIGSGLAVALGFGAWAGRTNRIRERWYAYPSWGVVYAVTSGFVCALLCVASGHCVGFDELLIDGNKDAWMFMIAAAGIFAAAASIATRHGAISDADPQAEERRREKFTPAERINFRLQILTMLVSTIVAIGIAVFERVAG